MYRSKGNTAAKPRRQGVPTAQRQAQYIAESIRARQAEGRSYTVAEYGIANMPEMVEMVARCLNVIR